MRTLDCNTLYGGFDGAKCERSETRLELIRELAPDVLQLQEDRGFEANGNAARCLVGCGRQRNAGSSW